MLVHPAEENYLKAIFNLTKGKSKEATTNDIADKLQTKASSVTDMAKRLSEKKLVKYAKYKGLSLTGEGEKIAKTTIRKHRLWEVFLVEKLQFRWDEVHEIAEQLEHIKSEELVARLDAFLGTPKFDPHGDPIPDENGVFQTPNKAKELSTVSLNKTCKLIAVKDSSASFLQYLDANNIELGTEITPMKRFDFDHSIEVLLDNKRTTSLSSQVCNNLIVSEV